MKNIAIVFAVTVAVFFTFSPTVFSGDNYIEGTIYDSKNRERSLAIINGQTYKIGDRIGAYTLIDIYANGALLKHLETGAETSLLVGRDTPPPQSGYGGSEAKPSFFESMKLFNPFAALENAKEAGVKMQIMRLKIALEQFYAERGIYPADLKGLTEGDYIAEDMLVGKGGYRFYYATTDKGYELRVEPEKPSNNSRFFFVDESGLLRAQRGASADKISPIAD